MSYLFVFLVFTAHLAAFDAASSPALIWSSSRPMSDLPVGIAGDTVSADNFHNTYLKPLAANPDHSLVFFVQNKLSVEDFTKHADVYNPNSDGGAFKNVKTAMDESFSVQLPTVSSPFSAIESLSTSFPGEVIKVDNPEDVQALDLVPNKSYMIIVNLQPVTKQDEYGSFQANDAAIGHCMRHLQKRGVKFSAVYTAEDSQISDSEVHTGRRLLAEVGDSNNFTGSFWSSGNVLIFMKSVNLTITRTNKDNAKTAPTENYLWNFDTVNASSSFVNDSIEVEMNFDNDKGTAKIRFFLNNTDNQGTQWKSQQGSLSLTPKGSADYASLTELPMDYQIESLKGYCYHCGKLVPKPSVRSYTDNKTVSPDVTGVELILYRFQLDISFNSTIRNMSNENTTFSADVWECVEFFTIPIWMGLLSTLLLMMILFYGITMISNITTMDRFDDPKEKTITVTVNE